MSKLFNVVKKDNILDFSDLEEAAISAASDSRGAFAPTHSAVPDIAYPVNEGRMTRLRVSALSPIFPFDGRDQLAAEQYRIIRTKILHSPQKPRLIVVSSGCIGDGKTVTSINIAASLALKEDCSVLLIDGDLRQPRVAEALALSGSPGLAEVLSGETDLQTALVRPEQFPNLFILPAGNMASSAAELLDSERWRDLVKQARSQFDYAIFDAPPIAMLADYELIQLVCDAAILVARPDHSNRDACLKALRSIPAEKMLGVVLNAVEDWWLWKIPTYGYYRQSASDERS
jgi:capsular exopolysaccharide synthesis family protein